MAEAARKDEAGQVQGHEAMMAELQVFYEPWFSLAEEPLFLYMDDSHKMCNDALAELFGYSRLEWQQQQPFLNSFVVPDQRKSYSKEYNETVIGRRVSTTGQVDFLRRDGSVFRAMVATLPVVYKGQIVSLNLVKSIQG